MISIANIKKDYRGRRVLDIDALSFELGKKYALLGTNGCGKSTLLKIIAGYIQPTEGTVHLGFSGAKAMGYLPQTPYGFSFSVLKNILIALDNGPESKLMAEAAIAAVGLSELSDADASRLSGGETQRMAFARIIAQSRKLLLLDEPTAAADLQGVDLMEASLRNYCQANECTVIFSTHSPAQALRLADEIIFLHQGKITERGAAAQLLNEPQSEVAQDFLKHWKL